MSDEWVIDLPEDPDWVLAEAGYDPPDAQSRAARFAISNGFLGVRAAPVVKWDPDAGHPNHAYVAGLFDRGPDGPALIFGPDWVEIDLRADGHRLHPGEATFQMRLDLRRGALITDERHRLGASKALRIITLRLVSRSDPALGLQLVELKAEGGEVEIDLGAAWGAAPALTLEHAQPGLALWRTGALGIHLAAASMSRLQLAGGVVAPTAEEAFKDRWRWRARPGEVARFGHAIMVTRRGAPADDGGKCARAKLEVAASRGWTAAITVHEAAWARRWRESDVEIEGDAAAQKDLRFALYHLIGAANPADDHVSIAARGLTGGDYKGHVFWDTEIYLLPFYTLTCPAAARALLMYRFHTLDAARAKARGLGWRGALYAWESAGTGKETTPEHATGPDGRSVDIAAGKEEQHISADVAYAVWRYWLATGDEAFLQEAGAEILLETGRFWASRAQLEADGRRHIRRVIGPDEYHSDIDDNAYTNVMARWTIDRALDTAALLRDRWPADWAALAGRLALDDDELRQWREAAETLVSGFDPKTGLYEQFAGYFGLEDIDLAAYPHRTQPMDVVLPPERISQSQVIKQADVVALLAGLPEAFPAGSAAANFRYYEARCGHGSSLSRVTHGVVAARLGEVNDALAYFRDAAAIDLLDSQGAIGGGVHIAGLGGLWMTAVYGFGGLTFDADGLALDPHLPPDWASLTFRIHWRGRRLTIAARQSGAVEVTLEAGAAMSLLVRGQTHGLRPGAPLVAASSDGRALA